jgi:hypothetical protein
MKAEEQEQEWTDLGNRVQSTLNAEDSLGVSRDGLGDVDSGVGLALYHKSADTQVDTIDQHPRSFPYFTANHKRAAHAKRGREM